MHKALVHCSGSIASSSRDWNNEFQSLIDAPIYNAESYIRRREILSELVNEFEGIAMEMCKKLIEGDLPDVRGFPQCCRVGNMLLKAFTDPRAARVQHRTYRDVLETQVHTRLHAPLSALFFFRGAAILAQALIPLKKDATPVYRGDGEPDSPHVLPVHACVRRLLDAMNVAGNLLPGGQVKVPGLEVYEGLDGRYYVTNAVGLFPQTEEARDRYMIVRREFTQKSTNAISASPSKEDFKGIFAQCAALCEGKTESSSRDLNSYRKMFSKWHSLGLNFFLLPSFLNYLIENDQVDSIATQLVTFGMFVRVIKSNFCEEITAKLLMAEDDALNRILAKQLGSALDDPSSKFEGKFFTSMTRKYNMLQNDQTAAVLLQRSLNIRVEMRAAVTKAVCVSLGATILSAADTGASSPASGKSKAMAVWEVQKRQGILPTNALELDVGQLSNLPSAHVQNAFARPFIALRNAWDYDHEAANELLSIVMRETKMRYGVSSMEYLFAALDQAIWYFYSVPALVEDGELHFKLVLDGVEKLCPDNELLLKQLYILRGSLFLHCKEPTGAYADFQRAAKLMDTDTISPYAGELALRPYEGFLRCNNMGCTAIDLLTLKDDVLRFARQSRPTSTLYHLLEAYGSEYSAVKHYAFATEVTEVLREVAVAVFGSMSHEVLATTNNLAFLYFSWDKEKHGDTAAAHMQRAVNISDELFGASSLEGAVARNNLAAVLMQLDRLTESLHNCEDALAIFEKVASFDNAQYATCRRNHKILKNRFRIRAVYRIQRFVRARRKRVAAHQHSLQRRQETLMGDEENKRSEADTEETFARGAISDLFKVETDRMNKKERERKEGVLIQENLKEIQESEKALRREVEGQEDVEFKKLSIEFTEDANTIVNGELDTLQKEEESSRMDVDDLEDTQRKEIYEKEGQQRFKTLLQHVEDKERKDRQEVEQNEETSREEVSGGEVYGRLSSDESKARESVDEHEVAERNKLRKTKDDELKVIRDELQKQVDGYMQERKAMKCIRDIARGFRARLKLSKQRWGKKANIVIRFALAWQAQSPFDAKAKTYLHRWKCAIATQQFLRAYQSSVVHMGKIAKKVVAAFVGYAARHRVYKIRVRRFKEKMQKHVLQLLSEEQKKRQEIDRLQREELVQLRHKHQGVRERYRREKEQEREAAAASAAQAERRGLLFQEEKVHRQRIIDSRDFELAQLARKMRLDQRRSATAPKASTVANLATTTISVQTEACDEYPEMMLPVSQRRAQTAKSPTRSGKGGGDGQLIVYDSAAERSPARPADKFRRRFPQHRQNKKRGKQTGGAVDNTSYEEQKEEDEMDTLDGYPLDELMQFIVQHEQSLMKLRECVKTQKDEVETDYWMVKNRKDAALVAAQSANSGSDAAWIPARPNVPRDTEIIQNGAVITTIPKITKQQKRSKLAEEKYLDYGWNSAHQQSAGRELSLLPPVGKGNVALTGGIADTHVPWERTALVSHIAGMKSYLAPSKRGVSLKH